MKQYSEQELRETLGQEMELPEKTRAKLADAYAKVRAGAVKQDKIYGNMMRRVGTALAAAAAVVVLGGGFLATNPALAAKLPIIGQLFSDVGEVSSFPGDYSGVGEALSDSVEGGEDKETAAAFSQSVDGVTMTLSEVYCNEAALYVTFEIQAEEGFADCMTDQNGEPVLALYGTVQYSFNSETQPLLAYPDGMLTDENTYVGLLRLDLQDALTDTSDYIQAVEDSDFAVYDEESFARYRDLIRDIDLPDSFEVRLNVEQIVGDLTDPVSIYEAAGRETPTAEEFAAMPEDEWQNMIQELYDSVPEYGDYPNQYENFWYDGPYVYEFDVQVDTGQTVTVSVDDTTGEGSDGAYSIVSVTKTPFELTVEEAYGAWDTDNMLVVTDAKGRKLPYGKKGGNTNVFQVSGYDLSSIDLYLVSWGDWEEYHIKGEYFEENEVNEDGQTLQEVLEAHCLYHQTVTFN